MQSFNDPADPAERAPVDAVSLLIKEIQKFNPDFKLDLKRPALSPEAMRWQDARRAAVEIAQSQKKLRDDFVRSVHDSGRIDGSWTFETLQIDAHNQNAVNAARGFCFTKNTREAAAQPVIFILQGAEGTGKTVICSAIANYFLEHGISQDVEIITFDELRRVNYFNSKIDEREDRQEREHLLDVYQSVNMLIIDSLRPEGLSMFDQKIFSTLLRTRLARRLSMVISISMPFMQLHTVIGDLCFESLKSYSVMTAELYGGSRRRQILVNGAPLL